MSKSVVILNKNVLEESDWKKVFNNFSYNTDNIGIFLNSIRKENPLLHESDLDSLLKECSKLCSVNIQINISGKQASLIFN